MNTESRKERKNMKKCKDMHGITLVTLAITIFVLLILAGVTISALTGDDGIINQSKLATEHTNEKLAKEEIQKALEFKTKKYAYLDFDNFKIL